MKASFATGEKTLYRGRFLALNLIDYTDQDGVERSWESAVRTPPTPAVMVLPIIKPDNEIVIIRQFRPPTKRYVWETPAGLIDPGEDPAHAALRELAEETGFSGKLLKILPPTFSSSGLSGESVYMAFAEINGLEYPPERQLTTDFDESENISTHRVKLSELNTFLLEAIDRGDGVDSKLLLFSEIYNSDR
ncbi:MAG: NUDIX hydrolase [Lentisphaerae bacterium]|nr:NUDIX hydrolase [Lentisphaerota bacterium]